MDTSNLIQNMISAAKLDVNFFNAVEHGESKNQEALMVVLIAAIASAIGNGIGGIFRNGLMGGLMGAVFGLVMVVVGYYLWSYLTHFIATRRFIAGWRRMDASNSFRTHPYLFPLNLFSHQVRTCLRSLHPPLPKLRRLSTASAG